MIFLINYSTWAFKFGNFSEFQSVVSDSRPPPASVIMTHCEIGDIDFQMAMWHRVGHVIKGSCGFKGESFSQ